MKKMKKLPLGTWFVADVRLSYDVATRHRCVGHIISEKPYSAQIMLNDSTIITLDPRDAPWFCIGQILTELAPNVSHLPYIDEGQTMLCNVWPDVQDPDAGPLLLHLEKVDQYHHDYKVLNYASDGDEVPYISMSDIDEVECLLVNDPTGISWDTEKLDHDTLDAFCTWAR